MEYPSRLKRNESEYVFQNDQVFTNPMDWIHGFVIKDQMVAMHIQDFTEINIITAGTGMHYIKEKRLRARRGDIFMILPDVSHGYLGEKDFEVYNIVINNRFMEKYMGELQQLPAFSVLFRAEPLLRMSNAVPLHLHLKEEQLKSIQYLLEEIKGFSKPERYADALVVNNLVLILIARLCEFYLENESDEKAGKEFAQEILYEDPFLNALTLIHEHYGEKLSISQLANAAQLSRSGLIRRFHEVCGVSPAKYLNRQRVEAAKYLLIHTGLSLAEIADRTGFYDASHFTKSFQAETGEAPAEFRRNTTLRIRDSRGNPGG